MSLNICNSRINWVYLARTKLIKKMKAKFLNFLAISLMFSLFAFGCQETKKAANDAADAVENAADNAADAAGDAMDAAGDAAENAADAAGDAMEDAAEAVDSTMEEAKEAVKEAVEGEGN
ncbi:MAG: hypothetical protein R8P61_26830 [Bacteroidia bacterium]|nr:hypothetical protein [Bacteroidia bacterium]